MRQSSSILFFLIVFSAHSKLFSQPLDTSGKIKLFFACDYCDFDFIRNEITFVDYVRDPAQADVHCFVIKESAANGGSRYTFTFLGHHQFENINDTLHFLQKNSNTPEEFRRETVHTLTLGLTRYVSHSPQASLMAVSCKPSDTIPAPVSDPWDSWVMSADINAYVYGEALRGNENYWGSLSANRITPDLKVKLTASGSYNENDFKDLGLVSITRAASIEALVVGSLGDHWSTGPDVKIGMSTYRNRKLDLNPAWGLEYNIFPYSESTSRQLRILYTLGVDEFHYYEETIFNKTEELLGVHVLSASLIFAEPWGSAELTVAGSQYLHDLLKTELNIFANLQFRLFEGLSLRVLGNYASIHDQIFLSKSGLTDDEILLQLHQLATDYSYFTSIGLTYTFGSVYNNVVNPRFGN